jgi:hypothetical protein
MWTLEFNGRNISHFEMVRGSLEFNDGGIDRAWWEDTGKELSNDELIKLNEYYDRELYEMALEYFD